MSVQVLHAHYQDTVGRVKSKEKDRQFYLGIAGALTLLAIIDTVAVDGRSLFLVALKVAIGREDLAISAPLLAIGLLFGTAVYAQLYFQSDVWIERTYRYVHELEAELCKAQGLAAIACEGRAYETKYPLFSWWTYFFYKYIIPSVLTLSVLVVPIRAVVDGEAGIGALSLLWGASLMTVVSASLYVRFIFFENKAPAAAAAK